MARSVELNAGLRHFVQVGFIGGDQIGPRFLHHLRMLVGIVVGIVVVRDGTMSAPQEIARMRVQRIVLDVDREQKLAQLTRLARTNERFATKAAAPFENQIANANGQVKRAVFERLAVREH